MDRGQGGFLSDPSEWAPMISPRPVREELDDAARADGESAAQRGLAVNVGAAYTELYKQAEIAGAAPEALIALANYIPESDFVPSLWQLENGIDEASDNRVTPDDIADASEEAWMLRGDIFAGKRMWEEALRCYGRPPPPSLPY